MMTEIIHQGACPDGYEINKSRFHTCFYEITHSDEVSSLKKRAEKEFPGATHYAYAFRLGDGVCEGCSDGGEIKRTAGFPTLMMLRHKKVENGILFVIRYYGGKKLGKNNLSSSYQQAAKIGLQYFIDVKDKVKTG